MRSCKIQKKAVSVLLACVFALVCAITVFNMGTVTGAAEAVYSPEGRQDVRDNVGYYMENASTIRGGLQAAGLDVYGGVNAPYIWLKTPDGMDSWRFFEALLNRFGIVGTPGVGFGPSGEGYFRLTAFGSHENTRKAMRRIADAGHWSEWKI